MRKRVWGVRGSVPTPGPETMRYGGNTSCVQVTLDDGTEVVLDAGTGIRPLGLALPAPDRPLHILTVASRTAEGLQRRAADFAQVLLNGSDLSEGDICFSAKTAQRSLPHRLSSTGASLERRGRLLGNCR